MVTFPEVTMLLLIVAKFIRGFATYKKNLIIRAKNTCQHDFSMSSFYNQGISSYPVKLNHCPLQCPLMFCQQHCNICIQGSHQWLFYHSLSTLDLPPPLWLSLHTTVFKPTPVSHPHQHLNCHSTHHPCVQRHLPLPLTSFIKFLYPFLVVPSF